MASLFTDMVDPVLLDMSVATLNSLNYCKPTKPWKVSFLGSVICMAIRDEQEMLLVLTAKDAVSVAIELTREAKERSRKLREELIFP